MIKKIDNCLYCGDKMESKTAKKKFCSAKCRLYYKREKDRGTLFIPKISESMANGIVTERKPHNHSLTLTVKPHIDEVAINERISVLKKEILKPPANTSIPLRIYKRVREQEISELEAKLNQ